MVGESKGPGKTRFGIATPDIDIAGGRVGILLVHGLGGTPVEFRFLADGLAAAGHTVSVPLLYGHGGSDRLLNTTTWNDWYGTVQEAHDKLKAKCDVVVAGGLSVGVLLALHLASERPRDVHALMLFSPTFWPNGWAIPKAFHLFRLFVRFKWFANLFHLHEVPPYGIKDERIRRFVLDSLQNDADKRSLDDIFGRRGGTILEFRWLADKVRRELGGIRQPALIFHPRTDDQSDLSNTILLQRSLGGLVETMVLNDSYHMLILDRQRTLVVARAVEFADALESKHRSGQSLSRPAG
jgi:carboxylesterase